MSWVTDVILIFSSSEEVYFENNELESCYKSNYNTENIPALQNINKWLRDNSQTSLDNISNCTTSSAKSMQSYVYAGAFNYLSVSEFIKVVRLQNWLAKDSVQLLIKEEGDTLFTVYTVTDQLN